MTTLDPRTIAAILRERITEEEEALCGSESAGDVAALDALTAQRLALADAISTMSADELSVTLLVAVKLGDRGRGIVEITSDMRLIDFLVISNIPAELAPAETQLSIPDVVDSDEAGARGSLQRDLLDKGIAPTPRAEQAEIVRRRTEHDHRPPSGPS